ncbi:Regulator of G-protein signaling 11 [Manis javanica]|nr:Regulator of G-protein signaling 11 [Manis javanica]
MPHLSKMERLTVSLQNADQGARMRSQRLLVAAVPHAVAGERLRTWAPSCCGTAACTRCGSTAASGSSQMVRPAGSRHCTSGPAPCGQLPSWTLVRVELRAFSFRELLEHPMGRAHFTDFLQKEFSDSWGGAAAPLRAQLYWPTSPALTHSWHRN